MTPPPGGPAGLRDALLYLREIGYGELYLPARSRREARPPEGAGRSTPAQAPPPTVPSTAPRAPTPPPEPVRNIEEAPTRAGAKPAAETEPSVPDAEERAARLGALADEAAVCQRCRLWRGRTTVVFGSGNPNADLMFVGEGPGAEEDRRGLPFVGAAGELLTKIIQAIELTRDAVYIANVVKCRPPGNRDPLADEASACRSYLDGQIELVRPKVIVALGRIAAQGLLGTGMPLGRMRGQWWSVQGVATRVTYHPAALLRNPAWKRPTWEDMQEVRDRLREPS